MQSISINTAENNYRNDKPLDAKPRTIGVSLNSARTSTIPQELNTKPALSLAILPKEADEIGREVREQARKENTFSLLDIFNPCKLFTKLANKLLYHPQAINPLALLVKLNKLKEAGLNIEQKFLKTVDDQFVRMWFAKNPNPNAPTKIYFHGNAGDITRFTEYAIKDFQDGYNVCLTSYRGFSNTNGIPTEQGLINDALAVFEDLIDKRGIPANTIDIEAASLGCAVALNALKARSKLKNPDFHQLELKLEEPLVWQKLNAKLNERFNHVTLFSPFASVKSLAKYKLKFIPNFIKQWFINDIWNNVSAIKDLFNISNIRIYHGTNDEVVPIAEGQKLFEAIRERCKAADFIVVKGNDHHSSLSSYSANLKREQQTHECLLPFDESKYHLHISENKMSHIEKYGYQHAIDIPMPIGSPIYAARAGTVVSIIDHNLDIDPKQKSLDSSQLNEVVIVGDDGLIQQYAHPQQHSSQGLIKVGSKVKAGQHICNSGHNGPTTEPHLHFALGYEDKDNKLTGFKSVPIKFVPKGSKQATKFTNAA